MTKEEVKVLLDKALPVIISSGDKTAQWHSQSVHKLAVGIALLDKAGIKDQAKRNEMLAWWVNETPSSFGTNSSAMGQSLGRPKAVNATAETFKNFNV